MGEYNLQVTIDQDSGFCFGVVTLLTWPKKFWLRMATCIAWAILCIMMKR